jgi:N-acetylneuraminate synthase
MKIRNYSDFFSNGTYIIAEIGGNFNSFQEAKKLILEAKKCGADAVKIQTYQAETLASKNAFFDMENTGKISQYKLFKKYQLSFEVHKKIFNFVKKINIDFFSTPAHKTDLDMLESFGVKIHKIGSDDAVNLPFLEQVAKTGKIIILSTGMCTLKEVKKSVQTIMKFNKKIALLHCVSNYPTYSSDVNLEAITTLQKTFPNLPIGYSDHTLSTLSAKASVCYGAKIVEKHFTLNKKAKGPDHKLSCNPDELKELISSIREIEKMKGTGVKMPNATESRNIKNNRKSIILEHSVFKGQKINQKIISIKRPGWGIEPKHFKKILGKKFKRNLKKDHVLVWSDIF